MSTDWPVNQPRIQASPRDGGITSQSTAERYALILNFLRSQGTPRACRAVGRWHATPSRQQVTQWDGPQLRA